LRFLIATWGNPWRVFDERERRWKDFSWNPITYQLLKDSAHESVESRSSLRLLYEYIKADRNIIIVADTVAFKCEKKYEDLKRHVRSMYEDFIERELGLRSRDFTIVVAPGVGRFNNGEFIGRAFDFYAIVFYELAKIFYESISKLEEIEIHLDLTHGINFMPVLTHKAVREIGEILALMSKNVRLVTYNSEPYVRGIERLNIHVIEDVRARPTPPQKLISRHFRPLNIDVLGKDLDKRRFFEEVDNILGSIEGDGEGLRLKLSKLKSRLGSKLNALLGALVNGLPLVLYTFYVSHQDIYTALKQLVKLYEGNIDIECNGTCEIKVERKCYFTSDFISLVKILLVTKILSLLGVEKKGEVSLEELDSLREKLFTYSKRLDIMISNDLNEIRETIGKSNTRSLKDWRYLKDIFGGGGFDVRNFLAHSGLECNITKVKVNTSIKLKYDEEQYNVILNNSIRGLEE